MATTRKYIQEQRLWEIRRQAQQQAATPNIQSIRSSIPTERATSETGYYNLPALKPSPWSWEVPVYFFTGGAAGAAAVLASVAKRRGTNHNFVRDAQWLAAIGGAVSPALLISDLGMPSRFLAMLRVFKIQSPMSVGSWTLMAFSSATAATTMLAEIERRTARRIPILSKAAEAASVLSGLVLTTYTGVLIGATAIPVWNENVATLPVHFAASGLASAVSILELRGHHTAPLNKLAIGAAAIETITGARLELHREPASESLRTGLTGWTMRAAGLLSGPVPLFLRLLSLGVSRRRQKQLRTAAALSALAGSFVTRVAWVKAGRASAKDPTVPLQLPQLPQPRGSL
jgi:formate-dependent nitrite reductase membrane component NrfD